MEINGLTIDGGVVFAIAAAFVAIAAAAAVIGFALWYSGDQQEL